jgi:Ca2+-binding RTX toxin-like protein
VTVSLFAGTDGTGDFGSASGANVGTDTLRNIEGAIGSNFDDNLNGGNYFFESFRGGGGNDTINGNGGLDNAEYTLASSGISVDMHAGTVTSAALNAGNDTLHSVESIWGSSFDDTYTAVGFGTPGANVGSINGGTYNVFRPGAGDDSITGNGDTVVDYSDAPGPSGLTINLAPGSTVVGGLGVGTDTLVSGINQVIGTKFADHFIGTTNANFTFEAFEGGGGDDLIDGGGGFDRAQYHLDGNISTGIVVNLAAGTVTGDPTLTGTDTLVSIEAITGSVLADTYIATGFGPGSTNAGSIGTLNEFEGMAGNDTIIGNGNTRIAFYHATGAVTVDLNLTTGAVVGDASVGTDSIDAVGEVSKVRGSGFNDTIKGNSFANLLEGQNGNDTLIGRGGNDTLTGGNGADTFVFSDGDGNDLVTDFLVGTDKFDFTAISGLNTYADLEALMTEANGAVTITFSPGNSVEIHASTGPLDIATLHAHQSDFLL